MCSVTNYGRRVMTDYVKGGSKELNGREQGNRDFRVRRRGRQILIRLLHGDGATDEMRAAAVSTLRCYAHLAFGPLDFVFHVCPTGDAATVPRARGARQRLSDSRLCGAELRVHRSSRVGPDGR